MTEEGAQSIQRGAGLSAHVGSRRNTHSVVVVVLRRVQGRFSGALEESSGKGPRAITHILSDIFVHLAPVEVGHAIRVDVEPGSILWQEGKRP